MSIIKRGLTSFDLKLSGFRAAVSYCNTFRDHVCDG